MGSKKILKSIRVRMIGISIFLGIVSIPFLAIGIVGVIMESHPIFLGMALSGCIALIFTIIGIRTAINPERYGYIKKNPQLLERADELMDNKVYEDKFIIYSDHLIASKKSLFKIMNFEDILKISESKVSFNFIRVSHVITLATAKGLMDISVYGVKRERVEQLKYNINLHCPNLEVEV